MHWGLRSDCWVKASCSLQKFSEKGKRQDHPIIHNSKGLAISLPPLQRNCAESPLDLCCLVLDGETLSDLHSYRADVCASGPPRQLGPQHSLSGTFPLSPVFPSPNHAPRFSAGEVVLTGRSDHVTPC